MLYDEDDLSVISEWSDVDQYLQEPNNPTNIENEEDIFKELTLCYDSLMVTQQRIKYLAEIKKFEIQNENKIDDLSLNSKLSSKLDKNINLELVALKKKEIKKKWIESVNKLKKNLISNNTNEIHPSHKKNKENYKFQNRRYKIKEHHLNLNNTNVSNRKSLKFSSDNFFAFSSSFKLGTEPVYAICGGNGSHLLDSLLNLLDFLKII